jgi:3',5'-cyclic AMP phosphodiesterase CpdA
MNIISRRTFLKQGIALTAGASAGLTAVPTLPAEPAELGESEISPKNPYADAVFVDGPPPPLTAGAFTIAVLPDTQNYSAAFPQTFEEQTYWLVKHRHERNIACVLHVGDLVDDNTHSQWKNAWRAMGWLDDRIPYFFVPGNHDYNGGGSRDRDTLMNFYFPVAKFKDLKTFGGVYDREPKRMDNSFHLFSAGGRNFLVLCLEFGPRRDVIRWANEVVSKHRDREAILVTHAFTFSDNRRYDRTKPWNQPWNPHAYGIAKNSGDDVADGEELWQELICRHQSFIFTINGHVLNDGLGRLSSPTPDGRQIPQMLFNCQMRPKGGDGWLRLLEMCPDRTMNVVDFSPTRKQCNVSPKNKFSVRLAAC